MKYHSLVLMFVLLSCGKKKLDSNKEAFIELNGNKIHSKVIGDGKPIILAHGGYLNLDMWNAQVKALSKTHKLIRFSDLGHGRTQNAANEIYGFEIIQKLIEENDSDKSTLIGLSWGAMICVDYVLKNPQNVDKLILVSPGLDGWEYFKDSIANNNFKLRQLAIEKNDTLTAAKLFHQNWVIGPRRNSKDLDKKFLSNSLTMINQTMSKHWMEKWSKLDSIKAITRLSEIMVPTYIIVGSEDALDILLIADVYEKNIINSKKIIVDGAAHLVNMEYPRKFNDLIKTILED